MSIDALLQDLRLSLRSLTAAPLNAARMVGRERDLGSVEPGKLADLLVLDANPLDDIRNTLRIDRVIKGGRCYDSAALRSESGQ